MSFQGVTAGYGERQVLRELSLQVPAGSVCALLGRNGAGKTTLLRTALGFLRISAGRVTVLGCNAWQSRFSLKDRIGYVAERQDLWPRMSGHELLALAARLYSSWDSNLQARLVDRYALPLKQRIGTYSKGMQIQLAQVMALAHHPEVLILDEPVANMDPVVRSEFVEHVLGYVHDTGASVLYSTHLVDEVRALADRVAFLYGGKIILAGPVDEVVDGYTHLLVLLDDQAEKEIGHLEPVAVQRRDEAAILTVAAPLEQTTSRANEAGISVLEARRPSLQELFIALLGEDNSYRDGSHARRRQQGEP
jgi:ABC-2 type transport system ATP-binding protein